LIDDEELAAIIASLDRMSTAQLLKLESLAQARVASTSCEGQDHTQNASCDVPSGSHDEDAGRRRP
jgi:hypothetical protein